MSDLIACNGNHHMKKPDKQTLEAWHQDPNNWKWKVFYYNKKDKRIFPPKRFKALGWTVNFANPISYIVLLLMIALVIALSKYPF